MPLRTDVIGQQHVKAAAAFGSAVAGLAIRRFLAGGIAWALLFSGWLLLGSLGRWTGQSWAGESAPLAFWLFAFGCTAWLGRSTRLGGIRLRALLIGSGLVTVVGLYGASANGTDTAVFIAAAGWGVLLAASAGVVRALRPAKESDAVPVAAAACGAVLAWALASDMPARPTPTIICGALLAAVALVMLVPRGTVLHGVRPGFFGCALPARIGPSWHGPRNLALAAARWTMLPMMASLAPMADWCAAGAQRDPSQTVGMHLAAMLLPALVWQSLRRGPPSLPWVALPALLAGALYLWAPDAWMPAVLLQSASWSLAWTASMQRVTDPAPIPAPRHAWLQAAMPAACVWMLGVALQTYGPVALRIVLIGLASATVAGALAAAARPGRFGTRAA